jgi:pimeloyl-ACP methyl ester carboxylesterase
MSTEGNATRLRASDAEREEFAQLVREATGDGRLSLGEGDERLAQVYAAKYRDELRPLVADLPAGAEPEPTRRSGRPPVEPDYYRPHPAAFARHAGVVLLVSSALIGLWALTGSGFFWPAFPLIFFGLGLVRHARWAGRRGYPYRSYPGRWSSGWPNSSDRRG